jgi:8-oxo-dGTP pyrophosphatase MutT (NUDIX family)
MMRVVGAGVVVLGTGPSVLAITRGLALDDLGFPGGRRDSEDSSAAVTAARELYEETGMVVEPEALVYVGYGPTPTGGVFVVYTPREIVSWPAVLRSEPFEGFVGWHPPAALRSTQARHGTFQGHILERLGL